ncbi:tyrosine-type recombinase/integrase [Geodermatophilus nigrescens]
MATIQDRWHRRNRQTGELERTALYGTGKRYRVHFRDPSGREVTKAFGRKVDAQRWLDEQTVALVRGTFVHPELSRQTVGQWAETWFAGRSHLGPKTLASYRSLLRARVLPRWEHVPLGRVAHGDVVAWVAGMRAAGLSASRTRQAYHLLTSMLDAAVKDGRLARNAAAGVDLPRLPTTDRRYLTHGQLADLADHCGPHRLLVLVLGYTGLRWGEAAALRVRRVDLLRGRIEVAESVTEVEGHSVFGPPKSHARRWVPVPRFLRDDLVDHLASRAPEEFVFPSRTGGPLRVGNFRRDRFDRAAVTVGLAGLVPHELRHTAASLAIASGASIKGVQSMLGHASAAMTLDRYGHLFGDELDAVAERMDAARADWMRTEGSSGSARWSAD